MKKQTLKKTAVVLYAVVVHALAIIGGVSAYQNMNSLNRLPEPEHSFFTVQCIMLVGEGALDKCACAEDRISTLDPEHQEEAALIALNDCFK